MALPVRHDLIMTSGAGATFEFVLTDAKGNAIPLDGHTVKMFLSYGYGKVAHAQKTSSPHYDATAGKVRFSFAPADVPARPKQQTWWYEVWRTGPDGIPKPHFCGELILSGTARTV
jgi:hypothetical protein